MTCKRQRTNLSPPDFSLQYVPRNPYSRLGQLPLQTCRAFVCLQATWPDLWFGLKLLGFGSKEH